MLLHIPTLSESIKLVLKEGSGPVHITVHVGTEIVNEEKVESPPAKKKNTCWYDEITQKLWSQK